ncbi:MAG: helix-turn-helix domain-containing protein [Oscillospiraceae bacterium]|nr:helix-turn-helix domain-containing protein [Oscillospiraceae bacterium]
MDYVLLGNNIRKYRKMKNLTQEQLAEKSEISSVFMCQIENANGKPSLETVVNIATSLEVSIDVLVGGVVSNNEIAKYINVPLNNKQLETISKLFSSKTDKEISSILKAIAFLLEN